jgi:mRNA interferase MazF
VKGFKRGDIVVVPFPFTDLSNRKRRPALILAELPRHDAIICQITSQPLGHASSIPIQFGDYMDGFGRLPHDSFLLPHRLVTVSTTLFERVAGKMRREKVDEVARKVFEILS